MAAVLLTCLPMLGDYFTSDMLSASPKTAMVGNLINDSVRTPGQTGQAGAFVMLVFLVALLPMLYYIRVTSRSDVVSDMRSPVAWWNDPWRPPRVLVAITVGYLLWSLLPVLVAVLYLVQRRPFAHRLAGLLVSLVLGRPDTVGLARRHAAQRAAADAQARRDHHG